MPLEHSDALAALEIAFFTGIPAAFTNVIRSHRPQELNEARAAADAAEQHQAEAYAAASSVLKDMRPGAERAHAAALLAVKKSNMASKAAGAALEKVRPPSDPKRLT